MTVQETGTAMTVIMMMKMKITVTGTEDAGTVLVPVS
jgi:hypothetical protein